MTTVFGDTLSGKMLVCTISGVTSAFFGAMALLAIPGYRMYDGFSGFSAPAWLAAESLS